MPLWTFIHSFLHSFKLFMLTGYNLSWDGTKLHLTSCTGTLDSILTVNHHWGSAELGKVCFKKLHLPEILASTVGIEYQSMTSGLLKVHHEIPFGNVSPWISGLLKVHHEKHKDYFFFNHSFELLTILARTFWEMSRKTTFPMCNMEMNSEVQEPIMRDPEAQLIPFLKIVFNLVVEFWES